jgi:hypothetical protein
VPVTVAANFSSSAYGTEDEKRAKTRQYVTGIPALLGYKRSFDRAMLQTSENKQPERDHIIVNSRSREMGSTETVIHDSIGMGEAIAAILIL